MPFAYALVKITQSYVSDLRRAITSTDVTQLENAIAWAEFDGMQADLRHEIYDAKERIRHLKGVGEFTGLRNE